MQLPLSSALVELTVLPEVGSTNAELAGRASEAPEFATTLTTSQTSGRGRLGRTWEAPPGQGLAMSVLLKPAFAAESWGWLPLIAGVAMQRTVAALLPSRPVTLKWPNDVQVGGQKISGILVELVPGGAIVGAGLNLAFTKETLPTPVSTSLALEGVAIAGDELADVAFSTWFTHLRALYASLSAGGPDAIRADVASATATIGARSAGRAP